MRNSLCLLILLAILFVQYGANQTCKSQIFEQYSSGWLNTERQTTTPQCATCTCSSSCACTNRAVVAGVGQAGTDAGGPCAMISSDLDCCGFSEARWDLLSEPILLSGYPGISTNKQTIVGTTNMNPPGFYDTALAPTGLYKFGISTDNIDDDRMGFVLGYEPLTGASAVKNRIEFRWSGKCCCDYNYPIGPQDCSQASAPTCCSLRDSNRNPDLEIYQVSGVPLQPGYTQTLLGRASGGGWERAVKYNFHVEFTSRLIRLYRSIGDGASTLVFSKTVPPTTPFDTAGTVAYWTSSQPTVYLGPLQLAGDLGFGTAGCSQHTPYVEVPIATMCTNNNNIKIDVNWNNNGFVPFVPPSQTFAGGSRLTEIRVTNPSLPEGTHTAVVRVTDTVANTVTEKTFSQVIVYPRLTVNIVGVATSGFPVTTCASSTPPNTLVIPWCRNTGTLRAVAAGGNGNNDAINYSYLWNGGATSQDITNVSPGTYGVTIDDAYNCQTSTSVNVIKMEAPTIGHSLACGGTVSISASSCSSAPAWTYEFRTSGGTVIAGSATSNSRTNLLPGSYTVAVGDSSIQCTGAFTQSYSFTVPPLTFNAGTYVYNGNACSGRNTALSFQFSDKLSCAQSDLSGTIVFGDGATSILNGSDFSIDPVTGAGSITISHPYLLSGSYPGSLTIRSLKHGAAVYVRTFTVVVSTLASITFPPERVPPVSLNIYGNYSWEWTNTFQLSDRATATMFPVSSGASASRVLENNIALSENQWYWAFSHILPGQYGVEIRRNSDGCLVDSRRNIKVAVATYSIQ